MRARIIALLGLVALVGCDTSEPPRDRRVFTVKDSWYAPPSPFAEFEPLANDRFATVVPALQIEAQGALADVSVKPISAVEAARFAGKSLPVGKKYVLVRAVVLHEGTGGFEIGTADGGATLHVQYGCLGRHPAPMTRKALVAVLPLVPEKVYVSCIMAE